MYSFPDNVGSVAPVPFGGRGGGRLVGTIILRGIVFKHVPPIGIVDPTSQVVCLARMSFPSKTA